MQEMKLISMLTGIAAMSLLFFALQLSAKVIPSTFMIVYASTNVTENSGIGNVPNLVTTPPPLLPSIDQTGDASVNRTNTTQVGSPTENYTSATALATEGPRQIIQPKPTENYTNATGPRQIITGRPAMGQFTPQNQFGQNVPNAVTGSGLVSIPDINITKEQAAKAEQEANVMIEAHYEKVKQEEAAKARQEAAALAAAQANQTTAQSADEAEESEESEEGSTTTSPDETETNGEGEGEEQEEGDNEDQGDDNQDENQDEEE